MILEEERTSVIWKISIRFFKASWRYCGTLLRSSIVNSSLFSGTENTEVRNPKNPDKRAWSAATLAFKVFTDDASDFLT